MSKFPFDKIDHSSAVLDRVTEAYGFSQKMQLADHLDMAASSLSARFKRGIFPADIVVRCVAETGASLEWLSTGSGKKFDGDEPDTLKFSRQKLVDGQLYDSGYVTFDKTLFREGIPSPALPMLLQTDKAQYVVDCKTSEVYDGEWLINVEGKISIRRLIRIPVKKVRVSGVAGGLSFDCALDEIEIIGRIVLTIID